MLHGNIKWPGVLYAAHPSQTKGLHRTAIKVCERLKTGRLIARRMPEHAHFLLLPGLLRL